MGCLRRDYLNREADSRQFAAGGNLDERLGRLTGIGAYQKLYGFQPAESQLVFIARLAAAPRGWRGACPAASAVR